MPVMRMARLLPLLPLMITDLLLSDGRVAPRSRSQPIDRGLRPSRRVMLASVAAQIRRKGAGRRPSVHFALLRAPCCGKRLVDPNRCRRICLRREVGCEDDEIDGAQVLCEVNLAWVRRERRTGRVV